MLNKKELFQVLKIANIMNKNEVSDIEGFNFSFNTNSKSLKKTIFNASIKIKGKDIQLRSILNTGFILLIAIFYLIPILQSGVSAYQVYNFTTVVTIIVSFIFLLLNIFSSLYTSKDNSLYLSMPIKERVFARSKLLSTIKSGLSGLVIPILVFLIFLIYSFIKKQEYLSSIYLFIFGNIGLFLGVVSLICVIVFLTTLFFNFVKNYSFLKNIQLIFSLTIFFITILVYIVFMLNSRGVQNNADFLIQNIDKGKEVFSLKVFDYILLVLMPPTIFIKFGIFSGNVLFLLVGTVLGILTVALYGYILDKIFIKSFINNVHKAELSSSISKKKVKYSDIKISSSKKPDFALTKLDYLITVRNGNFVISYFLLEFITYLFLLLPAVLGLNKGLLEQGASITDFFKIAATGGIAVDNFVKENFFLFVVFCCIIFLFSAAFNCFKNQSGGHLISRFGKDIDVLKTLPIKSSIFFKVNIIHYLHRHFIIDSVIIIIACILTKLHIYYAVLFYLIYMSGILLGIIFQTSNAMMFPKVNWDNSKQVTNRIIYVYVNMFSLPLIIGLLIYFTFTNNIPILFILGTIVITLVILSYGLYSLKSFDKKYFNVN